MSKIQTRLGELQPYVVGVRFYQGASVVDAIFNKNWHVPESGIILSEKIEEEDGHHYIFLSQDERVGLDEILDYVEQIIGLNIEREKKYELLKEKAKELQELFRNNPLSKLQHMKFVLGGEKLVDDMKLDSEDVVESIINEPFINDSVVEKPQPQQVVTPQPSVIPQQSITPLQTNDSKRLAPNGEIIPALSPEDRGEIKEEFQRFDLTNENEDLPVTKTVKGRSVDLPPKKTNEHKIELLEIDEPQSIICKCGADEVCPACEEEKIGHY